MEIYPDAVYCEVAGLLLPNQLMPEVSGLSAGRGIVRFKKVTASDLVTTNSNILGGTPVFKGTRVPIRLMFEYLERGYSLEEFLECFPSVTREMACQVLELSEAALLAA
jgi:uncharacterized protein (DUF433 family)